MKKLKWMRIMSVAFIGVGVVVSLPYLASCGKNDKLPDIKTIGMNIDLNSINAPTAKYNSTDGFEGGFAELDYPAYELFPKYSTVGIIGVGFYSVGGDGFAVGAYCDIDPLLDVAVFPIYLKALFGDAVASTYKVSFNFTLTVYNPTTQKDIILATETLQELDVIVS